MCTHSVSISGERAHIQLARQDSLNALWFLSTRQHHGHDNHRDQHHDHYIPWPTSSSWLLPCISIIVFTFKDTPNLEILMISITAGGWSTMGQSSGRQITFLWWEEEWFPWEEKKAATIQYKPCHYASWCQQFNFEFFQEILLASFNL